jgi:hypothetical protein
VTAPAAERRLSAAQLAALVALLQVQATARQRISKAAVAAALAPFAAFTAWWDSAAVDRSIRQVLRVVQPLQRQAARQTDAYMARVMTQMSGRSVRPVGAVDVTKLRRKMPQMLVERLANDQVTPPYLELGNDIDGPGRHIDEPFDPLVPTTAATFADPGDVYGRIADGVRYDIVANGLDDARARRRALVRVEAAAHTDITLAVRAQYDKALREGRTVRAEGWRRILRPDLSKHGPCGLCVVAADRIYSRSDLMPLHNGCVCEIMPIIDGQDPGLLLNRQDLDAIYRAAGGTGGEKVVLRNGVPVRVSPGLQAIRVALTEHGELGPVLVPARQNFRGMKQVAKTQSKDRRKQIEAQLTALEETFAGLIARRRAGENVDAPYEWQEHAIDKLRAELAALV